MEHRRKSTKLFRSVIDVITFVIISILLILWTILKQFLPKSYRFLKPLDGEIVLITGGGGGLGRLLAVRLAQLNATVVLWDVNITAVDEVIRLVCDNGGVAYGFKCDLTDKDDIYRVAQETRRLIGDVTILINNAGVVSGTLLLDTADEMIQKTFDVNILAHFWTVKAFLPQMVQRNHGHVVTVSSMAGHVGISKLVDYCASKYAAVGFDEALRVELEAHGVVGVHTTCICPYFIQKTGMFDNVCSRFVPTLKSNDVADRVVEAIRRNDCVVMIPAGFRFGLAFKTIVPWACLSMFLRALVPDAAPTTPPKLTSKNTSFHDTFGGQSMQLKTREKLG